MCTLYVVLPRGNFAAVSYQSSSRDIGSRDVAYNRKRTTTAPSLPVPPYPTRYIVSLSQWFETLTSSDIRCNLAPRAIKKKCMHVQYMAEVMFSVRDAYILEKLSI